MVTLHDQDRGRTVEVGKDSVVTVRLDETPGTGYRWAVETASGLAPAGERFEPGRAIGAAGVRVFDFRAATVGSHLLRMRNWRSWEGEGSIIGRFDATIVVK